VHELTLAPSAAVKIFLRDASIVVTTLLALFLFMAAIGRTLPLVAVLMGGSIGLVTAAARARRHTLEERAAANRAAANKKPRKRR